ncbi:nucleolar transcription factor 1-A-like [Neocloeon triangulifer]|uniref:nucleolar transcription factor 1-A-like n=1 Tax=Neocloeon triangulifer TaxID=2078957 RepID=UPI00286F3351|nr:nucleolar transcription factor 1-A-like [Neocloeon triangulifer]
MGKSKKRQAMESEDEPTPPNSDDDFEERPATKKAKTKSNKKEKQQPPVKFQVVEEEEDDDDDDDEEGAIEYEGVEELWPYVDLLKLFNRMETEVPEKEKHKFEKTAEKLNWAKIAFDNYSAEECSAMWQKVSTRLRRYRLLKELLVDAKEWADKPWTNFYRSQKTNRHPDMPKRPLSTYMMFYMEKKDKVAKEYPGLEMTKLSKIIATMYKSLPDKHKQKYVDRAKLQRDQYMEKMAVFHHNHPELKPSKTKRQKSTKEAPGPRKPFTPYQHYLRDKMEKHLNELDADKQSLTEQYKEAWKELSDKKRVIWIKAALDDEERYNKELVVYKEAHPDFESGTCKILNKDERNLYEKSIGKPEKPPNSGYSLFSRIMLSSEEIKNINHKDRMTQISSMWKNLSVKDKRKYHDKVQQMLEQYKLHFATYLESLTPEKREEELQNVGVRKRAEGPVLSKKKKVVEKVKPASKPVEESEEEEEEEEKVTKPKTTILVEEKVELFKGEPEAPPSTPFKLFLKEFVTSAKHVPEANRVKEAPAYWNQMSEGEKSKWRKRLQEAKSKYISKYENFLKSLTQEQLKEYSIMKARSNAKKVKMESKSDNEDEDDDDDDDDHSSQSSKSDDSSSGNESDTEDEDNSSSDDE